jgi:hypothetical protein
MMLRDDVNNYPFETALVVIRNAGVALISPDGTVAKSFGNPGGSITEVPIMEMINWHDMGPGYNVVFTDAKAQEISIYAHNRGNPGMLSGHYPYTDWVLHPEQNPAHLTPVMHDVAASAPPPSTDSEDLGDLSTVHVSTIDDLSPAAIEPVAEYLQFADTSQEVSTGSTAHSELSPVNDYFALAGVDAAHTATSVPDLPPTDVLLEAAHTTEAHTAPDHTVTDEASMAAAMADIPDQPDNEQHHHGV